MKIVKDMLTERGKYSQGRVYLLWSVIAYYITLGIITAAGVGKKHSTLDIDNFTLIVEALKYAMMLFAGYVFGGKFLDVVKVVGGAIKGNKEEEEK